MLTKKDVADKLQTIPGCELRAAIAGGADVYLEIVKDGMPIFSINAACFSADDEEDGRLLYEFLDSNSSKIPLIVNG